jgi:DNA-binding MarR family transcriptional regulator
MNQFLSSLPSLPCTCASLRRAARALTQIYEDALRPLGLRVTQFTILQVLTLATEVSQGMLAEILAMDSTTLTRTLGIMVRAGWIAERRGRDRREKLLRLSKSGRTQFQRALPAWEKTQEQLAKRMGERWQDIPKLGDEVTALATKQGGLQ